VIWTLIVGAITWGGPAFAGELHLTAGLDVQDTSWQDDTSGSGALKVGYRWGHWSGFFMTKSGYAEVDERFLQQLAAGGEYWGQWKTARPYLRLGVTHQHESPRAAVENDIGALLGYGSGIRHRGGAGGAVGVQYPVRRHRAGDFFVAAEANADWMTGAAGPTWYWGAGASIGFTYDFTAARR
jgi:hypothetical protein